VNPARRCRGRAGRRDDVVLAIEFGLPMGGEPNQRGGSPRWISGLLTAEDVKLSGDVLDRVDAIVPPGSEVDPADLYLDAVPALTDKRLRRR
jgi:hypothetical protein